MFVQYRLQNVRSVQSLPLYANSCMMIFYCDVIFVYLCTDAADGECYEYFVHL